jgi:hypothetical protein
MLFFDIIQGMKMNRNKTRSHFILFDQDSPFGGKKFVDRKKRLKRGYRKHRRQYD